MLETINLSGRLSDPAIKPVALWKAHQTRAIAARHGILGHGDIATARDANGLFYGPFQPRKVLDGLRDYMHADNVKSYVALAGSPRISA